MNATQISNWKDLREQFGLKPTAQAKSAIRICKELDELVKKDGIAENVMLVNYTIDDHFDGGHCTFQYIKFEKGVVFYEYTGTVN